MVAPVLALLVLQGPCLAQAGARAAAFDLAGAATLLEARGCADADVAALYVRGLFDARAAFSQGGSPESLAPVRSAIARLEAISMKQAGPAEIARLALQAAAAAAQSERDEMRVYLEAAIGMETVQRAAGQPGAPILSPSEIAGDLWFQIYRYDDARKAYGAAVDQNGFTLRNTLGLGRAHARLGDTGAACASFRVLLGQWGARADVPEITEARGYVRDHACASRP